MRIHFPIRVSMIAIVFAGAACKQESPPPAPKAPPATLGPKDDDLKAVGEFLQKDAPAAGNSSALPPGHPPIAGAPAAAATSAPDGLPSGHPPIGATDQAPPPPSEPDAIAFDPPANWKSETPSSSMRKAQYRIPGAKPSDDGSMVVFYFGQGQGGGLEMNIDRWKGMFSTPEGKPVPDSAVKRESREVNGMKVTTLEVTGRYVDPMAGGAGPSPDTDSRMLSAIVETPQGLWFFKGVGPALTMAAQTENFKRFVTSIKKK